MDIECKGRELGRVEEEDQVTQVSPENHLRASTRDYVNCCFLKFFLADSVSMLSVCSFLLGFCCYWLLLLLLVRGGFGFFRHLLLGGFLSLSILLLLIRSC